MRHVIESQQFDRETIELLFERADTLQKNPSPILAGKILASLFYEPSTRTRFSFESAMLKLGGSVMSTENAREFSSAAKGETLEDSIRVFNYYADVIVLRHPEKGSSERAASVATVPIINAGDGAGQHPTQALLDLYTIQKERGAIDGSRVLLVGDLAHGRTVRSLSYLLGKFKDVSVTFVSPKELKMGDGIKEYLDRHGVHWEEKDNWDEALTEADVLYQTRIQKERFADPELYARVKGSLVLTPQEVARMKGDAIIMHPLPRVDEIDPAVDELPQARYFEQAGYGLPVRMALLEMLLKRDHAR